MKRISNLFDKISSLVNFFLAYKNAIRNKKHYREVKKIEKHRERYIYHLCRLVKENLYKVSEYFIFQLWSGNKWREVYKLPMKDRIVQHALMNILEPIFRSCFITNTFQSIKGRGTHLCLKRVKKALKDIENTLYCLKLDIHKCYPSVDKNILKDKLRRKFKDSRLLNLLFIIIDSCAQGLPIGNYTSQYLNNFNLSELDHYCKEVLKIKYYFRYCDDIVIFGKSKEELRVIYEKIKIKIEELNLKLKENYQIFPVDKRGVDFVGYVIYRTHILVRKRTKIKFIKLCQSLDFDNLSRTDVNRLGSYWGIFVHADCRNLWLKYTGVKKFSDLHVKVHERMFVKDILDKTIIVKSAEIYYRKGERKVRLTIDIDELKDVYVSTSGEVLIEAIQQLKKSSYPFETQITIDDNGYFKFI